MLFTFLEITQDDILTMIGYTADLFSDLKILVLLIVGVSLSIMFIAGIISATRGHK